MHIRTQKHKIPASTARAHTEAAAVLRRRGQGGAAADGAEFQEVVCEGGADGEALVIVLFPPLVGEGLGFGDLGGELVSPAAPDLRPLSIGVEL